MGIRDSSKDATKVTFTTFAGLTDGKTYDVTLDGTTKQVVVSDGKVTSVTVNKLTVPVATELSLIHIQMCIRDRLNDGTEFKAKDTKVKGHDFNISTLEVTVTVADGISMNVEVAVPGVITAK